MIEYLLSVYKGSIPKRKKKSNNKESHPTRLFLVPLFKSTRGCRGGLETKHICCSCRGLGLGFQHPLGSSQLSVTPLPRDLVPFSNAYRLLQTHVTCQEQTQICKIINKLLKLCTYFCTLKICPVVHRAVLASVLSFFHSFHFLTEFALSGIFIYFIGLCLLQSKSYHFFPALFLRLHRQLWSPCH